MDRGSLEGHLVLKRKEYVPHDSGKEGREGASEQERKQGASQSIP